MSESEAAEARIASLSFSLKLDWAGKHVEHLRQATQLWLGTDAYVFVPDTNPHTRRTVVRAKITKPPPPFSALIIGDAVHALRATLDHVALELAGSFQRPQPISAQIEESSEFVIIGDPDEASGVHKFDSAAGNKLKWIDPKAREIIKGIQPYHRKAAYAEDPLWIIHELDRIDKHRRLNLTAYALGQVKFRGGNIEHLHVEHMGHRGPVVDGTEVAAFTAHNAEFEMNFSREIALAEPSLWNNPVLAVQTLTNLHEYVRAEVLPFLTPFL